jgi:hypothetical protein
MTAWVFLFCIEMIFALINRTVLAILRAITLSVCTSYDDTIA